ncbi:hypothetical protein HPB50_024851 [Hyalomma asiaticum]|uniref:Uncharacterized protein n=1 Tax=Hyalomma asiaticum TaxID=266040 RepID=A0ACB7SEC7_HYAAI|nr:hypothetical protein HPB50_024851 [Hyalomma asiaticum]
MFQKTDLEYSEFNAQDVGDGGRGLIKVVGRPLPPTGVTTTVHPCHAPCYDGFGGGSVPLGQGREGEELVSINVPSKERERGKTAPQRPIATAAALLRSAEPRGALEKKLPRAASAHGARASLAAKRVDTVRAEPGPTCWRKRRQSPSVAQRGILLSFHRHPRARLTSSGGRRRAWPNRDWKVPGGFRGEEEQRQQPRLEGAATLLRSEDNRSPPVRNVHSGHAIATRVWHR